MPFDRRLLGLVAASVLLAVPAVVLQVACVGNSCDADETARADVPFCSLPSTLRGLVEAGYREGRSAEILAAGDGVSGATGYDPGRGPSWPGEEVDVRVPLFLTGEGVNPAPVPTGTTLDGLAPTLAEIAGLDRAHPEVRSGKAIDGLAAPARPRLLAIVVASGVGSRELEPHEAALRETFADGTGTMEAETGSQPLDPAAVLATVGTGGLPYQHGITGRTIRNDDGRLVEAWGRSAPVSVIATLADDLDESTSQRALVGAALSHPSDRGIVGGNWYVDTDTDEIVRTEITDRGLDLTALAKGAYGRDEITDLFAVVVDEGAEAAVDAVREVKAAADRASRGSYTLAFTATGSLATKGDLDARDLASRVEREVGAPVIEGVGAGGFFLDTKVQTEEKISEDRVIQAMRDVRTAQGTRVFADVFPALAVSFARYC